MANRIYVLTGLSGAGKDTLAGAMMQLDEDIKQVQWVGIAKRTYENWYGIPTGSLDDRVFRARTCIPKYDKTYLQVLVDAYHAWNDIDPRLTIRPTLTYIKSLLDLGFDVVITDTRKREEADDLYELVMDEMPQVNLFHCHIMGREGEARLASDDNLAYNKDKLVRCSTYNYSFINDNGMDSVYEMATTLLTSGYWLGVDDQ